MDPLEKLKDFEITLALLAAVSKIPADRIINATITADEWVRLVKVSADISTINFQEDATITADEWVRLVKVSADISIINFQEDCRNLFKHISSIKSARGMTDKDIDELEKKFKEEWEKTETD